MCLISLIACPKSLSHLERTANALQYHRESRNKFALQLIFTSSYRAMIWFFIKLEIVHGKLFAVASHKTLANQTCPAWNTVPRCLEVISHPCRLSVKFHCSFSGRWNAPWTANASTTTTTTIANANREGKAGFRNLAKEKRNVITDVLDENPS